MFTWTRGSVEAASDAIDPHGVSKRPIGQLDEGVKAELASIFPPNPTSQTNQPTNQPASQPTRPTGQPAAIFWLTIALEKQKGSHVTSIPSGFLAYFRSPGAMAPMVLAGTLSHARGLSQSASEGYCSKGQSQPQKM